MAHAIGFGALWPDTGKLQAVQSTRHPGQSAPAVARLIGVKGDNHHVSHWDQYQAQAIASNNPEGAQDRYTPFVGNTVAVQMTYPAKQAGAMVTLDREAARLKITDYQVFAPTADKLPSSQADAEFQADAMAIYQRLIDLALSSTIKNGDAAAVAANPWRLPAPFTATAVAALA